MVHHGDWIVAKAAGCATISIEGLGLVDFWVTHVRVLTLLVYFRSTAADDATPLKQTVAAGGEDGPEYRRAHRITQAYELARFARNSAKKGHHVVCVRSIST